MIPGLQTSVAHLAWSLAEALRLIQARDPSQFRACEIVSS